MSESSDTVDSDLDWVIRLVGDNVMRVTCATLALFAGQHYFGFPGFAPSGLQLLLIVIGGVLAIGLSTCWVAWRQWRRVRSATLLSGNIAGHAVVLTRQPEDGEPG